MNRKRMIALLGALALGGLGPSAAGDSASVDIRAQVPIACSASLVSKSRETSDPLFLRVTVERNCNAIHTLSVTYEPAALSAPSALNVVFDGAPPSGVGAGTVTFSNLAITNSQKTLTIAYSGPSGEGDEIEDTVAIQVSVP